MHTYDLTEDKAKEVLDFLAKKAGYCKLSIKCKYGSDKSRQFIIACKRKLEPNDVFYDVDYRLYVAYHLYQDFSIISIGSKSYANALKIMLEMSKNGKDIFCRYSLMLPARTNLEEILIKMDLSRYE